MIFGDENAHGNMTAAFAVNLPKSNFVAAQYNDGKN